MPKLLMLFNYTLTAEQEANALLTLRVLEVISPPQAVKDIWGQLPPDAEKLRLLLEPIREWIIQDARAGDHILIQRDFRATYLMANFAMDQGMIPLYSTTKREAAEERLDDGTLRMTHWARHVMFRRYGRWGKNF